MPRKAKAQKQVETLTHEEATRKNIPTPEHQSVVDWRLSARSNLRIRHHSHRRRTMGPPLDHHRHLARGAGAGPRQHHGRALSCYLLADSLEGQRKETEITRSAPSTAPTRGNIRDGFVYERVPHITLKSIANNAEIGVIWERFQKTLEPLREKLNSALGRGKDPSPRPSPRERGEGEKTAWEEWEIPHESGEDWPAEAREAHARWWEQRIARQKEIDASIAAKAGSEYLYDKPCEDKKVCVAGPFTVESISPHRVLGVDENDELIEPNDKNLGEDAAGYGKRDFTAMILENLKTAGVQQAPGTTNSFTPFNPILSSPRVRYPPRAQCKS